jgi:LytS/YehU family sensor histidine kinase
LYALLCHASDVGGTLFYRFHPNLLSYCAVAGFTQAFGYFQRYQQREREIAQLQLDALKSQLQPHFLFNALHTISAMMHVDPKSADRMMSRLSDLLRLTLATIGKQEVTLAEEITFVEAYMEIERVRFGERLEVRIDAEPEAMSALVPVLFLQPLVENCIRHGLVPMTHSSLIEIHAQRRGDELVLTISDNGRGLPQGRLREGIGLANSRSRLEHLYPGSGARLNIEAAESNGARVSVVIPFHTVPAVAESHQEPVTDEHSSLDRRRRALGTHSHQYAPQR